jgi:hypothetical protein
VVGIPFGIADAAPDVSAMPPRAAIPPSASLIFIDIFLASKAARIIKISPERKLTDELMRMNNR